MSNRTKLISAVAIAIGIWTIVAVVAVVLLVPGQVAPCPGATRVGLSDAEREAILQACSGRSPVDQGLMVASLIWLAGAGLLMALGVLAAKRARPTM